MATKKTAAVAPDVVAPAVRRIPPAPVLEARWVPIDSIKPYERNPRQNAAAIGKVAASLRQFGWQQVIVIDDAGVILAGHTRWHAARQLGLEQVPVSVAANLTPLQARAYRLADNRSAEDAVWNMDLLRGEVVALDAGGMALGDLGFDPEELNALLGIRAAKTPEEEDQAPAVPRVAVAQLGDVYQCGMHRVVCGDATDPASWAVLLAGDRPDCLITDPPYDVAYRGGTAERLTIANDDLGHAGTVQLLRASLGLAKSYLKAGAQTYVFAPHGPAFLAFAQVTSELGLWRQTILWVKDRFAMGRSDYHYRHEAVVAGMKEMLADPAVEVGERLEATSIAYGVREGAARTWIGDRKADTVWEFPRPARNGEHPTMKPLGLVRHALARAVAPGGMVVDCFAGSGSTLMAADALGVRARVLELDPRYVDVILERWRGATGQAPVKLGVVLQRPVTGAGQP